jgi:uncharacterized ion transporter superfamily protein YfcC
MSPLILFRMLKNKFHSKKRFPDSYVILLHTHIFHTNLSYILPGQWSQQSIYLQLSHVNYWLRPTTILLNYFQTARILRLCKRRPRAFARLRNGFFERSLHIHYTIVAVDTVFCF